MRKTMILPEKRGGKASIQQIHSQLTNTSHNHSATNTVCTPDDDDMRRPYRNVSEAS